MKIILRIATPVILLQASLFAAHITTAQEEIMTLETEGIHPPFKNTEANGSFSNFEIELENTVSAKAKPDCEWVKPNFSGMMRALPAGKYDVFFSAISMAPDLRKVALFSIPYLNDGFRLYGAKNNSKLDAELSNIQIGMLTGSTEEQFVRQRFPNALTHGYGNMNQVNADPEVGRIDSDLSAQLAVTTVIGSWGDDRSHTYRSMMRGAI
jgi:ABC-type amino acid transport substrate-binding protein